MSDKICPIILSGGSGTRLWPLSRKSYPKQFTRLIGEESLFQAAANRLSGPDFAAPVIVTGNDFRFIVAEQLAAVRISPQSIIIEPDGRNTAPAVLAAALLLDNVDPDTLLLVSPSDHTIPDAAAFRSAVIAAAPRARAGDLVTFGISPTRAETGYGWLELSLESGPVSVDAAQPLVRFVEKPGASDAQAMLAAGNFLWNAGIFLFSKSSLVAAFERYAPEVLAPVRAAAAGACGDLGFTRLMPETWEKVPDISIDYAIMEKADNLAVMPFDGDWSDLGGWEAVWQESNLDEEGNTTAGHVIALDCRNTLLRSEAAQLELVGIGLEDIVAVAMPDAVLVAHRSQSQKVKEAVATLRDKGARQAEQFSYDHRPWGRFESLAIGARFQVKRIVVNPRAALSLQRHHHRSEHWVVVEGTALVTVNGQEQLLTENQSVYIPLGAVHRLENPGKVPVVMIEVQTGAYLGEDDIIRYEDVYARGQGAKG